MREENFITKGRLSKETILITGACSGIGLATTYELAKENPETMVLISNEKKRLDKVSKNLSKKHRTRILTYDLDVSKEKNWKYLIKELSKKIKKIDVLINSAGINRKEIYDDSKCETWDKIISVNQTGVFLSMKYCKEFLKKSKNSSVVNLSSITAVTGYHAVAYTASKWAVRGLTKSAALEYGKWGIRVNSVLPGFIETNLNKNNEKFIRQAVKMCALNRKGSANEIAKTILFLASNESSYITGADIIVDGGLTAGGHFKQIAETLGIY